MKKTINPIKVYTSADRIEADLLVQALKDQDIPAYKQGVGTSGYLDIYTGNSIFGEDIFVDEPDREAALEVIHAIVDPAEPEPDPEEDEAFREEVSASRRRPVLRIIAIAVVVALVVLVIFDAAIL